MNSKTPKRDALAAFVNHFKSEHARNPTYKEIEAGTGLRSHSICKLLMKLRRSGVEPPPSTTRIYWKKSAILALESRLTLHRERAAFHLDQADQADAALCAIEALAEAQDMAAE